VKSLIEQQNLLAEEKEKALALLSEIPSTQLAGLKARSIAAAILSFVSELPNERIAKMLKVSPGTIRNVRGRIFGPEHRLKIRWMRKEELEPLVKKFAETFQGDKLMDYTTFMTMFRTTMGVPRWTLIPPRLMRELLKKYHIIYYAP
jgi:hypothetical protein